MKITILSLILILLVSACSHKSREFANAADTNFVFSAEDITSPAEVVTDRFGTFHVDVKLSGVKADDLRQFTQAHLNQQVEISFGSNVLTRPIIREVIPNGEIMETFPSSESNEAWTVANLLNKK
jgi:preprotein translocase subunit SecD